MNTSSTLQVGVAWWMLADWIPTLTTQVARYGQVSWKSWIENDLLALMLLERRPCSHVGDHAHTMTNRRAPRTIISLYQHLLHLLLMLLLLLHLLLHLLLLLHVLLLHLLLL